MKPSFVHSLLPLTILVIGLFSFTACSPNASDLALSPGLGPQLQTAEAESVVITLPTPVPPKFADLTQEEVFAGLDENFVSLVVNADPAHGEELATSTGCFACHSLDPEAAMTGPTWHYVADHAMSRTDDSPALYIYHSITDPNLFVVDGYPTGIMPQNYSDILSDEDIASIMSFLLTQHE